MKVFYLLVILASTMIAGQTIFAQTDGNEIFDQAKKHFEQGDYKEAISVYDEILEIEPDNIAILKMKGIAQSNLNDHNNSLKQFFRVLQYEPDDVISLTGMGIGFGNLGEYKEAISYFERASKQNPDSIVINNYKNFINSIIVKYPYTPTEKPKDTSQIIIIPQWLKTISGWWADGDIQDSVFYSSLEYLLENKIIQIPAVRTINQSNEEIPQWVKENAKKWSDGQIENKEFVTVIKHLIENGKIKINVEENMQKLQKDFQHEVYLFDRYLRDISSNISKEKRYIEYPNPSQDVIKKFLRDYIKWNFEEEIKNAFSNFPDPTYQIKDEAYIIYYKIFINEQPTGLPLDHVGTLKNSFAFWEEQELNVNSQKAKVQFEITDKKFDANVWVTWVVRELCSESLQKEQIRAGVEPCQPDRILGHANVGKGVVEVALGDYNCDGSFQLYDVQTVETIMTHELGHSIGLYHTDQKDNIMYPSLTPSYAYCLLS